MNSSFSDRNRLTIRPIRGIVIDTRKIPLCGVMCVDRLHVDAGSVSLPVFHLPLTHMA